MPFSHCRNRSRLAAAVLTMALPGLCQASMTYYASTSAQSQVQLLQDPNTEVDGYNADSNMYAQTSSANVASAANSGQVVDYGGNSFGWSATTSGSASATYGMLHLYATAQAHDDPAIQDGAVSPAHPRANTACYAYFGDSLTITSNTQPVGTPVQFHLTTTLDANLSGQFPSSGGEAIAQVTLTVAKMITPYTSVSIANPDPDSQGNWGYIHEYVTPTGQVTVSSNYGSATLTANVGDTIQVLISGWVSVATGADWQTPYGYATANAANTAFFNLDPISDGASYTTESGLSYATPVPEPTSLALLGLGGLTLLNRRRNPMEQR